MYMHTVTPEIQQRVVKTVITTYIYSYTNITLQTHYGRYMAVCKY